MRGHIVEDQWMDVIEGVAAPDVRAHLEACTACRATVEELRRGFVLADEAEVPEPSPLYWDAFRERVGQAIAAESAPRPRWAWARPLVLAAAASVVVAVALWKPLSPSVSSPPYLSAPVAAWSPLPAAEDDPAFPVLIAVSSAATEDVAGAEGCADVTSCVMELSDEETEGLAQSMREEMGERTL